MRFSTTIAIPEPQRRITLHNSVVLLGSCFAQKIGERMRQSGIPAHVNPFGVLYSPVSILQALTANPAFDSNYFCDKDGRWHCWLTDSTFNSGSRDACKAAVLSARGRLFAHKPDTVIITLGTNRYYAWRGTGEGMSDLVVGNCHKQPQQDFSEHKMGHDEVVTVLDSICQLFPSAHVIFTVSPYRYTKYGFHESQLAKATLLLAVNTLCKQRPEQVSYFPAYEIMMDELRDYRFYAPDMLHPSDQAVEYIWERFADTYFDDEAKAYLIDYEPIRKALQHRPEDPDSPAFQRFLADTALRRQELVAKYHLDH